jgi:tape measure domain-containing protein
MEVFGLGVRIKEEGAATVEASLARLGKQFAATYLGVQALTNGIRKLVQTSDTMLLLEGRIGLVATSTENLQYLQDRLYESANLTRSSYEATAELYARVARNSDQLGYSQETLLKFTELTQMSIRTSGINAIEASRGMIQLSQALASGVLRGDEFRAVMEQMPGLSAAIAAGLGVTVKGLREMSLAGELTAQNVMDAVLKMEKSIREDFKRLPVTVGDGLTIMGNAFAKSLENANKMTGASQTLGTALKNLAVIAVGPLSLLFGTLGNVLIFVTKLFGTLFSTVSVIALGISRLVIGLGTIIINMFLTPLTMIPVIGEKIVDFLDKLNEKTSANDAAMAGWQEQLKEWRSELIKLEIDMTKVNKSTEGAGEGFDGFGNSLLRSMPAMGRAINSFQSLNALLKQAREEQLAQRALEIQQRSTEGWKKSALFGVNIEAIKSKGLIGTEAKNILDQMRMEAAALRIDLQNTLATELAAGIAFGLADGLTAGFQAAFAGGGISEGFKALTASLLGGLGSMLIDFGTKALLASELMATLKASFASLDPITSAAAAIALIGLGSALKGAAQASFGGAPGRGSSGVGTFRGAGMSSAPVINPIVFGATSATTAAGMTPRQATNITIIGPNDPSAQRAIQELMNKANSRGRIG